MPLFSGIWNSWKLHNDKQMFFSLLQNLLLLREERNVIFYIYFLLFLSFILTYLVNTLEMMDDLMHLAMKLFLKNQQWMWQHSFSNITHLMYVHYCWIFKRNSSVGMVLVQKCCWKRKRKRCREIFGRWGRERERKGVVKSCFLDPPLYIGFFFNFLACKKLYKHTSNKKRQQTSPKKILHPNPKVKNYNTINLQKGEKEKLSNKQVQTLIMFQP